MGISIQAFRIQIGNFHCSLRNIKVQKLPRSKLKVHKCRKLVFCVVAVVLLIIQSSFQWSQQGVKQNKLCKIIHGNRRSLGYKLALWNCGRGLLPRSCKMKEIEQFIVKYIWHH